MFLYKKKILVHSNDNITGGSEALHQFCSVAQNYIDCKICYINPNTKIPKKYKIYNVSRSDFFDDEETFHIIPEIYTKYFIEKIKNNCVFVGEINQIVNIKNGQRFRIENFNNFYKFLVKPRRGNLSDLLLRDPNFRRVDSFWYRPEEKLIKNFEGKSYINLYVPPVIKPKEGDAKPFLDLINYMFGKRDAYVVIQI